MCISSILVILNVQIFCSYDYRYEVSKLNEETYISNTYSNNRTNTVGDSTVLNFGTEYEIHLMPNCVGTSSLTQNKSDENDNQGVSHQIIPYTGINNDQNELIYSGNSTKNNNRNQTSLSIYPSSLESANKPQIEISNPRSIGKSNLYQETNHDLDNPDYWMPVKHRSKTNLSNKYSKKLRLFVNAKNRLISKVKKLESRKQNLLDIQLKYLTLRKRVLETENILLVNGFDTSKYSAFRLNNDLETSNNVEHEMSSGDININLSTNKNSISHPASSFSEVLPSAEDENFIL